MGEFVRGKRAALHESARGKQVAARIESIKWKREKGKSKTEKRKAIPYFVLNDGIVARRMSGTDDCD